MTALGYSGTVPVTMDEMIHHAKAISRATKRALLVGDLLLHKHEDFTFAAWFSYYGIFGFVACVVLVITAKGLRRLLMRDEDYYER